MKQLLLIAFFAILQSPVFAQYKSIFPFQLSNGKILVRANVQGVDGNFILDTGAPLCFVDSFIKKMNLQPIAYQDVQDSNGKITKVATYKVDSMYLGGVKFQSIHAMGFPKGNALEHLKIDGIIGFSVFGNSVLQLNGQKREGVICSSMSLLDPLNWNGIDMVKNAYIPLVPIALNGTVADTIFFDSGDAKFYTMSERKHDGLVRGGYVEHISTGHGVLSAGAAGVEAISKKYKVRAPKLSIGYSHFMNVTSISTEAPLSRIGSEILNYGTVTIDYPNGKFYYNPYSLEIPNMYMKDWNVIITVMNDELKAGFIWESASKLLEGGEKIVEINGTRYDKVNAYEVMTKNIVNLRNDTSSIVVIDKMGKEKSVTIWKE